MSSPLLLLLLPRLSRATANATARSICTPSRSRATPPYPSHAARPSARAFSRTFPHLNESTPASPPDYLNAAEQHIFALLRDHLQPSELHVQDISGGCGSMYGIEVVSSRFAGLSVIKQHRLVNGILKAEMEKWHGVQLKTRAP